MSTRNEMSVGNALKHAEMNFDVFDSNKDRLMDMNELRAVANQTGTDFSSRQDTLAAKSLLSSPGVLQQADMSWNNQFGGNVYNFADKGLFNRAGLNRVGSNYKEPAVDFARAKEPNLHEGSCSRDKAKLGQYGEGEWGSEDKKDGFMDMLSAMMNSFMASIFSMFESFNRR